MSSYGEAPPSYSESQSQASLTDILPTLALRTELALLLLLCTDAMRKDLIATFGLTRELAKPSSEQSNHVQDLISLDEDNHGTIQSPEEIMERRRRREQELASSQLQGLQRAALMYFDGWRGKVLKRTCEALGVRAEVVRQARKTRQKEIAAEAQRAEERDLLDWAEGRTSSSGEQAMSTRPAAIQTPLLQLERDKRLLLLNCTLLLLLSLETYPAHSRLILQHLSASLQLPVTALSRHESAAASTLLAAATQLSEVEKRQGDDLARRWKVGLATVAGAGLLAVTGGLAAPLLAAGVGTVLGGIGLAGTAVSGLLGALAGSSVLIGGLFGAMGGRMTGKMVDRYAKEVEDFKFVSIQKHEEQKHKLRVAIGISGWITEDAEIEAPWRIFSGETCEPFALRWELDALLRLGVSLKSVLKSYVWKYASFELARKTLLGALAVGLWPLGLLKMASVIDNPFSVAIARADKTGKVLADSLIAHVQGERPVTLVGYSLGARVIYSAMLELATHNAFGLVENVVLIGTPAASESKNWTKIRSVVCDRVVNVHSTKDYILGLIYRASSVRFNVAGLQAIEDVNGVENFDVTHLIESHDQYRCVAGQILKTIGFADIDDREVQAEREALRVLKAQEKVSQPSQVVDAEVETAEITEVQAAVEEQVGANVQPVGVDEKEQQKRLELVRAAERQEHKTIPTGHTRADDAGADVIAEPSSVMENLHISQRYESTTPSQPQLTNNRQNDQAQRRDSARLRGPASMSMAAADRVNPMRNENRLNTEDEESDEEPRVRITMVDMEILDPMPLPDDDDNEAQLVHFR